MIRTYTGKMVEPAELRSGDVCIEDIAHALSQLCRYGGHTRHHYSVAEHSMLVSRLAGRRATGLVKGGRELTAKAAAREGLLHDAAEAYVQDLVRSVKHLDALLGYRLLEANVYAVVAAKFGLPPTTSRLVDEADKDVVVLEKAAVMGMPPKDAESWAKVAGLQVEPMRAEVAEALFLQRYYELWGVE